ncbi:MAG: hypothetical protein PHX30_05830 [Candidatus Pacebacteria bacterium]|jgi:hypothetical protein|nr:hypothetical protein [Candidatus Paceibacterota bacterium]
MEYLKKIALAQDAHEGLDDYIRTIGFDPSIKEIRVSYGEGGARQEMTVEGGMEHLENVVLVKILKALANILPTIERLEDEMALIALLQAEYNEILLSLQLRNDKVTLAALLIKRAGLLRKELQNIKSGDELKIVIIDQ